MLKYIKNKNGWAMTLVMILIAVVPLLATALYMYASNSILHAERYEEIEQSKYLARSGTDAIIKVWLEAEADDRPSGTVERVYFMANGQFMRESELTTEQIQDNTIGYIDSTIVDYDDPSDDRYGSSFISTTAKVNNAVQTFNVITSSRATGNDLGWYNQNNGQFNLGPNVYTYESNGETMYLRSFDPAGIVTCDTDASQFTVQEGKLVGITGDAVFFKKGINLISNDVSNAGLTALMITSKHTIFEDQIYLEARDDSNGGTIVVNTSENTGIEVDGKEGLYSMVYFNGGVRVKEWYKVLWWWVNIERTVIEPGTAWYVKLGESENRGVNLLEWFYDENANPNSTNFFQIGSGDPNKVVPSEAYLVKFIYE